jgi:hypothetical protein
VLAHLREQRVGLELGLDDSDAQPVLRATRVMAFQLIELQRLEAWQPLRERGDGRR